MFVIIYITWVKSGEGFRLKRYKTSNDDVFNPLRKLVIRSIENGDVKLISSEETTTPSNGEYTSVEVYSGILYVITPATENITQIFEETTILNDNIVLNKRDTMNVELNNTSNTEYE